MGNKTYYQQGAHLPHTTVCQIDFLSKIVDDSQTGQRKSISKVV